MPVSATGFPGVAWGFPPLTRSSRIRTGVDPRARAWRTVFPAAHNGRSRPADTCCYLLPTRRRVDRRFHHLAVYDACVSTGSTVSGGISGGAASAGRPSAGQRGTSRKDRAVPGPAPQGRTADQARHRGPGGGHGRLRGPVRVPAAAELGGPHGHGHGRGARLDRGSGDRAEPARPVEADLLDPAGLSSPRSASELTGIRPGGRYARTDDSARSLAPSAAACRPRSPLGAQTST